MIRGAVALYKKNQRWLPIAFFIGGFVFDALMLRRVDEWLTIAQQALYLFLCAGLIRLEFRTAPPPPWLARVWPYREAALNFLMGTLLNAYTIFFFKSASGASAFAFVALLVLVLVMNEFGRFGRSQTIVRVAFFSLCLISYLVTIVPIALGFIGDLPFLIASACAALLFYLYLAWMRPLLANDPRKLRTHLQLPFAAVLLSFIGLYFLRVIPPVPLSVRFMGIYHNVEKSGGDYVLSYERPARYFWEHGDQTFLARPGDAVYCFVRVFGPARFNDELKVRWLYRDPRAGWRTYDVIPLLVSGGRQDGWRGVTKKTNYQPGDWRVAVETVDGLEIGRITFTITPDPETDAREFKTAIE